MKSTPDINKLVELKHLKHYARRHLEMIFFFLVGNRNLLIRPEVKLKERLLKKFHKTSILSSQLMKNT